MTDSANDSTPSDSAPPAPTGTGRDLFRHLLRIVNDPASSGAFTARIVEAGDLTELEISFGGGRIENVRTPGNPSLLPRVIGGGRKAVEKRMNGRPNDVKEDAAALHALLVSERVLPAEEIDESLSRLVSRCLLPHVASESPEAEWRDDVPSHDEPLGLEFDPCFRAMFENGWRRGALGALTPEPGAVLAAATKDWRGLPGPRGSSTRGTSATTRPPRPKSSRPRRNPSSRPGRLAAPARKISSRRRRRRGARAASTSRSAATGRPRRAARVRKPRSKAAAST
jgi:hypothetical protein